LAAHGADGDALLRRRAALALDGVAVLAAEAGEEVLRSPVAVVAPMELESHAQREPRLSQLARVLLEREEHLQAGNAFLAREAAGSFDDRAHGGGAIFAGRDQHAAARARRERHGHAELRVVREPGPRSRARPIPVAAEVAVASILQIGGCGGDHASALEQREMPRGPSRPPRYAARPLQHPDPVPTDQRPPRW